MDEATRREGEHDKGFKDNPHVEFAHFIFYGRSGNDIYEAAWTSNAGWSVYRMTYDENVYDDMHVRSWVARRRSLNG